MAIGRNISREILDLCEQTRVTLRLPVRADPQIKGYALHGPAPMMTSWSKAREAYE